MPAPVQGQPDMSVVRGAVKARGESADQMMERLRKGENPFGEAEQKNNVEGTQQSEPPKEQRADDPPKPTHPTPPRQPEPQQEQRGQEQRGQEQRTDPPDHEQRYRSLRGQYDGLKARFDQMAAENQQLRDTVARLETKPADKPPAPVENFEITQEMKDEYGEDFFEVIGKFVKPQISALEAENARLRERLDGVAHTTTVSARDRMHQQLDQQVPGWGEVNQTEAFINWLALSDEASGQPRQKLILEAYNRNETARVAYFFRQFAKENGDQSTAPEPSRQDNGRAPAPKSNGLDKFAAPAKGKSNGAPKEPEAPSAISASDITKFYHDKAMGRYRGREAEAERMEREIFLAQSEGRIQ